MNEELKIKLINRGKSFLWRTGSMVAVALIAFLMEQLKLFSIPPVITTMLGLFAGEATKWLNNHTDMFGVRLK